MAPKGWEWDEKLKEWFSDYPENIELEENLTTPSDWEPRYRSLGECTGTVRVWQDGDEDELWYVTAEIEGPGVSVEHVCGELLTGGPEPDWSIVEDMVGEAYDAIYGKCMDQALDNEEGDF